MGDHLFDIANMQQHEYDNIISEILNLSDEQLYLKACHSEDSFIRSIGEYYCKRGKLSDNQREILANWILKNNKPLYTEGYYWCKINDNWEVCFFNDYESKFERIMDDSYTSVEDIQEIDEYKIERK